MLVSSVIILVLNAVILRYVYELENKSCKCAIIWQHQFIKYFAPVVILFALLGLFVNQKSLMATISSNKILGVIFLVYMFVSLIYHINLVLFFLRLQYSNCECSEDWKRWGLLYPALGFAIILLVAFVVLVFQVFGLLPFIMGKLSGNKNVKPPKNNALLNSVSNAINNNKKGKRN